MIVLDKRRSYGNLLSHVFCGNVQEKETEKLQAKVREAEQGRADAVDDAAAKAVRQTTMNSWKKGKSFTHEKQQHLSILL